MDEVFDASLSALESAGGQRLSDGRGMSGQGVRHTLFVIRDEPCQSRRDHCRHYDTTDRVLHTADGSSRD